MSAQPIKKYYIGMLVLFAATLVLFVYVATLSSSYKQDKKTNQTASKIAEDLNKYILNKGKMPENLDDATDETVPSSVTYKKAKDTYTFCVTYKTASEASFNTDPTSLLVSSLYGGGAMYNYDSYNYQDEKYQPSELYISTYSWQKGEQCTTVKPYTNSFRNNNKNSIYDDLENGANLEVDYSDPNYMCDENYQYYSSYEDYCVNGVYESPYN